MKTENYNYSKIRAVYEHVFVSKDNYLMTDTYFEYYIHGVELTVFGLVFVVRSHPYPLGYKF
jgi:hypothetical protein